MTLITYPTRVHFADDVLEEALYSELERMEVSCPLIVGPAHLSGEEFAERVLAGLPRGTIPVVVDHDESDPTEVAITAAIRAKAPVRVDAVIGYGSVKAIAMARAFRAQLSPATASRTPYFAIPDIDGLPDPCRCSQGTWREGLPTVIICDPTLTAGATQAQVQRAAITSLVRCVESYLATSYNPLADGMALDGMQRCLKTIPRIGRTNDLSLIRDVMAAGLNAAMSQAKGLGPTQTVASVLGGMTASVDPVAAARLILPGMIAAVSPPPDRTDVLRRLIGEPATGGLDDSMRALLVDLPLTERLSQMGLNRDDLKTAAEISDIEYAVPRKTVSSVLEAVF